MDKFKKSSEPAESFSFDRTPYDVLESGTIGLLALGDVGLMAWRQKRLEDQEKLNLETKKLIEELNLAAKNSKT